MTLIVELVPHLDAGDRTRWNGDQDGRPLTDLGHRQAAALAGALVNPPPVALYSSLALRCRQTLQPLASRLELPIIVLPDLRETHGFVDPSAWVTGMLAPVGPSLGGAFAAGRASTALARIRFEHRDGRVIACSHGDLVPALVAFFLGAHALEAPPPLERRGWRHTLTFDGERVSVATCPAPSDFPM